jgi:hypothetical protein
MGLVGVRSTDLDRFEVEARPGGLVRLHGRLIRDPVHACPTHPDRGDVADLATADTSFDRVPTPHVDPRRRRVRGRSAPGRLGR